MEEKYLEIVKANIYGLVDSSGNVCEKYIPRLLFNDIERSEKVLTSIIKELENCEEFYFSVAFVAQSGVAVFIDILKELEAKGVKGTIIASEYQQFTQPNALQKLLLFKNIELRIITEEKARMHTKGYIFKNKEDYTIIIGSSNLTQSGLCENKEWNIKLSSSREGWLVKSILDEFNELYKISTEVNDDWIEAYRNIYIFQKKAAMEYQRMLSTKDEALCLDLPRVNPNKMQTEALKELYNLRTKFMADRALVISATGTGKTFLSAFDVRIFGASKFLFVVHRETIAREALKSYQLVMGKEKKMCLISGGNRNEGDFYFATVQTLSKKDVLNSFDPDYFDYIVVDEVHRAGAPTYKKIFDHFLPKFWLGMSATPERGDGFDIFKLFDYNIAYEIRLQDAMREQMICPFHYYGVSELIIDGEVIDDKTEFVHLASEERVKNIIEKIEFYGFSGDRVKGLIFCSRRAEAAALSNAFNQKGYRTLDLSGMDTQDDREEAIRRLESDDREEDYLDYIFSVDIFNEGVDIPSVNQVVMLRPTQSAIIFIQQLGRGLRKYIDKDYLVVIDFIGNYENNFLIPIALSGDKSYNKDTIRRYMAEGNRIIPGSSTVSFDKITKKRIYEAIDKARFNKSKIVKESYLALKKRLGKIPLLHEFDLYGSIDYMRIVDLSKSYYSFLIKYDKDDYKVEMSPIETDYIDFISSEYISGKRPHELEMLNLLISEKGEIIPTFRKLIKEKYPKIRYSNNTEKCLINQMTQNYKTGSGSDKYKELPFLNEVNGSFQIAEKFNSLLANPDFSDIIKEIVEVGLDRYFKIYSDTYEDTNFKLYEKYTYDDVFRGLDWAKQEVSLNVGGYKYEKTTNTMPVFINYDKSDEISATIQYEDRFISDKELIAISKSKRNTESVDIMRIRDARINNTDILLFVRKNKDDHISKEFYFLGKMESNGMFEQFTMSGTSQVSAVEIGYNLHSPVREDIFDYLKLEE